jgi:23S rRNA pseudouridine2605 synthase
VGLGRRRAGADTTKRGSRRQCEELILAGRIEVDRHVLRELGARVDPHKQEIRVDGELLQQPGRAYYAVNKPIGVVTTNNDPARRPRVVDLVSSDSTRLFAVGRLDLNSEGLILVTNDGELAHRLTHPRFGVAKVYRVLVAGQPDPKVLATLRQGVRLAEGIARAERIVVHQQLAKSTVLEMVLREGRNREIRRMFAQTGHKVLRLLRIAVGPIRLGKLPSGHCRRLTDSEVDALRRAVRGDRS